jgi:hypothetical protein
VAAAEFSRRYSRRRAESGRSSEEDWALLDELAAAVAALSEKLRAEPELSRDEAMLFVKTETNAPGVCFRSIVWPALEIPLGSPSRINSVLCLR